MQAETYNRRAELKTLLDLFTDKLMTVNEILCVVTGDDKQFWLDKKQDIERKLNNIEVELGIK